MKIYVKNNILTVKSGGKVVFESSKDDLGEIALMSERPVFPEIFQWLNKSKASLKYIILVSKTSEITIQKSDSGFRTAVEFIISSGWDLEGAVKESLSVPFVRVQVVKVSSQN